MTTNPPIIPLLLATAMLAYAQDTGIPSPRESGIVSQELVVPRILGEIPDGTPPPPAPPKPVYQVSPGDILSNATHRQGGRTVTIRQIKPIALPQPPAPPSPAVRAKDAEFAKQAEGYREEHPRSDLLFLGATVFRAKGSAPRTLVRYWPEGGGKEATFWTAVDYSLIAGGINSFVDAAGDTHHLMIGWSNVDIDRMAELRLPGYELPEIPDSAALVDGGADLHIIGESPAAADLAPLQDLHELYNNELARLKTAYHGRENARIEREEYLKANPPLPKDFTLNFWRTETSVSEGKGGAK